MSFIGLFILSASTGLQAQERSYLGLTYTKNSDGTKTLKATLRYKEDRKFLPAANEALSFYTGVDLDELLEELTTDANGIASLEVSDDVEPDSTGYFNFGVEFDGNDKLKRSSSDVSVKDARLELVFSRETEGRTITVNGFEIAGDSIIPLSDQDVSIRVPSLFGEMVLGRSTLDEGTCTIKFPSNLPGDSLGVLNIIAKIEDSDDFGNVIKIKTIPWGIPKAQGHIEQVHMKGELWTHDAPLWMVITLIILLVGVWSHFGYIVFKLYHINKDGKEKA
jgi:hypothetical protein